MTHHDLLKKERPNEFKEQINMQICSCAVMCLIAAMYFAVWSLTNLSDSSFTGLEKLALICCCLAA